ncbi:hypothetical protein ABW21_db0205910 [Orbilia brochopaga]|nr:hypothetical protein ABW21_db0205910 [Drechslerella brochopaga]
MRYASLQWTRLPPRFPLGSSTPLQIFRTFIRIRAVAPVAKIERTIAWGKQAGSSFIDPPSSLSSNPDERKSQSQASKTNVAPIEPSIPKCGILKVRKHISRFEPFPIEGPSNGKTDIKGIAEGHDSLQLPFKVRYRPVGDYDPPIGPIQQILDPESYPSDRKLVRTRFHLPAPRDTLFKSQRRWRETHRGRFVKEMQKGKVTIEALLQSITKAKPPIIPHGLSKKTAEQTGGNPDRSSKPAPTEAIDSGTSQSDKGNNAGYHILCLEHAGFTMIKSDIQRIFSNHEALVKGWQRYGGEIAQIVPARSKRLKRLNRYYLYFHSEDSMFYHLNNFAGFHRGSEAINHNAITLPPAPVKELPVPDTNNSATPIVDTTAVRVSKPTLKNIAFGRAPREGHPLGILYEGGGAPGRTVVITLCAHTEWQYLEVWLRYDVLEKGKFGRYMVPGGDNPGNGLHKVEVPGTLGGKWLVRFEAVSEAERLVREWDGKWVNVRGNIGVMRVELLW